MKKFSVGGPLSLLPLFMVFLISFQNVLAADLFQIDKLIKENKHAEAYRQASLLQDEYAGQPNFDFLFAIAAIESGHPHQAVFALERLILQFPDNGRVKVELARAHFLSGNINTADELFNEVLASSPPANVEIKIRAFLVLIEQRRLQLLNKLSASIKITAGWDSNYNSAPDLNVVTIGALSFTLNENSRQQDTNYTGIEANLTYQQRINKKTQFTYAGYLQQRENVGNDLDTLTAGIFFSPQRVSSAGLFRLPIQYQQLNLDGENYRNYTSLGLEWLPETKTNSLWTHFLQYGLVRYPDYSIRDMDLSIIGSTYQTINKHGSLYQLALHYSTESSHTGIAGHLETETLGMRTYGKWPLDRKNSLYGRITLQNIEHGGKHPVFNVLRQDRAASTSLGWELNLTPVTVLNLEAAYLQNSSNINVYDYVRKSAFVSLRYDFQ